MPGSPPRRGPVAWLGILGSPIEGRVLVGPNWFASVMGTGIVAVAGATLPIGVPELLTTTAWALAVVLLVGLLVFMPWNWFRHPENVRAIADDVVAIQFCCSPVWRCVTTGPSGDG